MKETELVKRCKKADRKAQEELYARYANSMFRLAFRYIRSKVDTEDVMMVVFTKVFANIINYHHRGDGGLEAWIRQIAVNEALMWLRRRHNFNMTDTLEACDTSIGIEQLNLLPAEDIYQFIANLPAGYRTVFNLYVVEGYDHSEIAALLGTTVSTSRTQLFKAKALLKTMLTEEGYQYGT